MKTLTRVTFSQSGAVRDSKFAIKVNGANVGSINRRQERDGYYWVVRTDSVFVNTAGQPGKTIDQCKAEARAAIKGS